MKRFSWVTFSVLIIVISSMLPLPFTEAAQAEAGKSPLQYLTNGANSIIVGTVVEHSSYWNDEHTRIYTSVVLSVEERLKGTASQDSTAITLPGGEVDEIGEWVSDMPSFDQGERVVVFLKELSKAQLPRVKDSKLQLPEEQFEVYGGFRGKFTITGDKIGDLPLAKFKERVNKVLNGQALSDEELDVSLSVATSPYSYSGLYWPHPPAPVVSYRINENCADCTGEGAAVQAAAATWNAAGAQFSFSYAGTTTATTASYDGVNEIMWRNFGSGGTIALTTTWYYTSNYNIVECDMEFNDYYIFSTAATPPSGQYDVQTVALHEFGHFLMLNDLYDSGDSTKVMYGYGSTGTTKRALHADDIAGIRYIYWVAPTPPNAPSNLTATSISSSQINLTWQDNSSDETGFKIERKTGASGTYSQIATVGAGVTSYNSTSLSTSTTYYYRVRAYSAVGNSDYSNEASATTLPPPPSAPTLKSPASASIVPSRTPRLEWNASSGATDYGLQVATTSSFTTLLVNDTGITNVYYDIAPGILNWNTTYYWRVNARNSYGSISAWSSSRYFKTAVGPPPNAPSNLTANPISSSQINLTWQDNSSDEAGFKIERKTGSGSYSQIATAGAGVTSYSNTGLSAGTTYYYRVRAYNAAGNSNYSNEASATTLPPPPSAPTLKSLASGSTVASLTSRLEWNAPSGAVSYGIQVATSSSFATLLVNETGITNVYYDIAPGVLKWNTTYYWRVNASNSFGSTSSWSSYRYFKTAVGPPPNAPSDLIATPISSSRINLTWQDNSDDETGFKIERRTSTGSYSQIATVGAGITSYSSTGLTASTAYYYRVRAYKGTLNSGYCEEASATTLPPPPSAPTLKSPASGSIVASLTPRLEWNAPSGAVSYGIQVATSSRFTTLLVNETGVTDLYYDLAPGTFNWNSVYYWRVNASNSFSSTSSWSSYRYFRTPRGS